MINLSLSKIKEILRNNLSLGDFLILRSVEEGKLGEILSYFPKNDDSVDRLVISSWLYINSHQLTPKAKSLLKSIQEPENEIYKDIYLRLQAKMVELTGKRQRIIDKKYSFFPNFKDFQDTLSKIIVKYRVEDLEKVEKVLHLYIERCHKANFDRVQLLQYYLLKNNTSSFMTDLEGYDYREPIKEKSTKIDDYAVNI